MINIYKSSIETSLIFPSNLFLEKILFKFENKSNFYKIYKNTSLISLLEIKSYLIITIFVILNNLIIDENIFS